MSVIREPVKPPELMAGVLYLHRTPRAAQGVRYLSGLFEDNDLVGEWCENQLLAEVLQKADAPGALADAELFLDLDADLLREVEAVVGRRSLPRRRKHPGVRPGGGSPPWRDSSVTGSCGSKGAGT